MAAQFNRHSITIYCRGELYSALRLLSIESRSGQDVKSNHLLVPPAREISAINNYDLSRHEATRIRRKIDRRPNHLFRGAESPHGRSRQQLLASGSLQQ